MESLEESNCHSMSDSFSLYERYMRSFNIVDNFKDDNNHPDPNELVSASNCYYDSSNSVGNIDLAVVTQNNVKNKHCEPGEPECKSLIIAPCDNVDRRSPLHSDLATKPESPCTSLAASLLDNSSGTVNCLHSDKSDPVEVPVSSDDSKSGLFKHPVFITSTMENSNNAVDSVPMFCHIRNPESIFKLPISELSFNGTIKHVKKLKPIVDPITALTSNNGLVNLDEKTIDHCVDSYQSGSDNCESNKEQTDNSDLKARSLTDSHSSCDKNNTEKTAESSGDSQYEEFNLKKDCQGNEEGSSMKWNLDHSYSSLEASFDSGVRSPDIFSDDGEEEPIPESEPFWSFLKNFEAYDKKKVRKIEKTLQGVLPPPSVTVLKTDVTEMLKKYYCFLPAFTEVPKNNAIEVNSVTPTKRVSFIQIPTEPESTGSSHDNMPSKCSTSETEKSKESTKSDLELDTSTNDKSIDIKMCTQIEAAEMLWPDVLKYRCHDVYYNITKYSEKFELLALRYGERFVGAETDTSVSIHSGGLQSPSSASKRKALRLKMAQAKSPGRRLSHLARRRQAFCSAATINEKAQATNSRMVLIDKNFFPHRKLINTSERKSPRLKRTPGKKTPGRKTPGKKTPAKTPKTRSGGSSRKKAMRRLLMDPENLTRSQPTRETLKRALFVSPENRKTVPSAPCTSVPLQAMRSKRALFGSPDLAQTKSSDGSLSDQFLKRKRDMLDDELNESRSKIAKSLSFGGDSIGNTKLHSFSRRASEMFVSKTAVTAQLNENHKKKLLWAVSEALRPHGWSMSSPGFREKASALARLTRKLLTLTPHAARLASPHLSTSDTMLKLARRYVFSIIQGRSVDDCYEEEQVKVNNEASSKVTGYISATAYQQLKTRQPSTSSSTSQIKENTCSDSSTKLEQPRSTSKNILQDKLVNIDANSNSSSSGLSMLDKTSVGLFKSNSMPSFEEAAKMRARRQISFDNTDFPKR